MPDSQSLLTELHTRLPAYLNDLQTLVSLDSYSYDRDDVNRVVDWLAARLSAMGFTIQRHPNQRAGDDLVASLVGTGKGRIVLLGHSDTVFPRGTTAARPMTIQGDKILGPGTCDMKGGLLAGLYAVAALQKLDFHAFERLDFLIVSDEEVGDRHAIPLIRTVSRASDAVLTLEAARANGDIVVARKGVVQCIVEAHGHSAHAGVEPEKGRSAISAIARLIPRLEALNDPAREVTLNVGTIEGGRLPNVVPDFARIHLEARGYSRDDLEQVSRAVLDLCAQELFEGVQFSVPFHAITSPPMPLTPKTAALEALAKSIATQLGFQVNGARTGGAADAAYAADEGVPALDGLGPIGGLDHGPDEYMLKSSIVPRIALLTLLIMRIAAQT